MPKLQMIYRKTMRVIVEEDVEVKDGKLVFQRVVPDIPINDIVMLIDGKMMKLFPAMPQKREIVGADQIIETYWAYGEKDTDRLKSKDGFIWKSKQFYDLDFHVIVKDGNDGKLLRLDVKTDDGREISLKGIVSKNKVVFNRKLGKYF